MSRMRFLGIAAVAAAVALGAAMVGPATASDSWQSGKAVAAPGSADPSVIVTPEGLVRLYYNDQNGAGVTYAKTSYDQGVTWKSNGDPLLYNALGVSVVRAYKTADLAEYCSANNGYRAYYQNRSNKHLVMAVGSDGMSYNTCKMDVAAGGETPTVDTVAEPAVLEMADGTWLMAYVGYNAATPTDTSIFWATSTDGIVWKKQGLARAAADAPMLVIWDDGAVRMYFHDAKGISHVSFAAGVFGATPELDVTDANATDPAVVKYNGHWHLFYTLLSGKESTGVFDAVGPVATGTAPSPTVTPIATPSVPAQPTQTATPSPTATPTQTATPSPTATPTQTATPSPTATPTQTATPSPTATAQRYFVKCRKGDAITYRTGVDPKCPVGWKQVWRAPVRTA